MSIVVPFPPSGPTPPPSGDLGLETLMNRKQTLAFISADPKPVTLLRSTRTPNGSGGFVVSQPSPVLPPQQGRLIPNNRQTNERMTSEGVQVIPDMILMMVFDADVLRYDRFEDQGRLYEVVWLHEKRTYQTKCEVVSLR